MSDNLESDSNWTLITIDDPAFLPGKSIFNIIQLLSNSVSFNFIILNEIYGVTEAIAFLEKKENFVMKINEILPFICKVKQFDWGDFFLFKEYPKNWNNTNNTDYPNLVVQSDTTVRAIDDQYIYVYTPYDEIIEVIKENYQIESIKKDSLKNLDYPY